MKLNKDDAMDWILSQDNDVLVELNDLIKDCFKRQSSKLKYQLKIGDKVRIKGSNKIEKGTITKVNRTRAIVEVVMADNLTANYNVPFTMITKENNE